MIRPFSATLSSTYNLFYGTYYYPANLSIDNDVATYAEADTTDTASWLLMTFSYTDIKVKLVTLVLYSTASGHDASTAREIGQFMTDAVVYVVDSAGEKHQCGIVELDLQNLQNLQNLQKNLLQSDHSITTSSVPSIIMDGDWIT